MNGRGHKLWVRVLLDFELDALELELLGEVCRTVELLDRLDDQVRRNGPVLPWGDGVRANPAAVEARQQRLTLARLARALTLPASDPGDQDDQGDQDDDDQAAEL